MLVIGAVGECTCGTCVHECVYMGVVSKTLHGGVLCYGKASVSPAAQGAKTGFSLWH